jgi:UDP-2,4-diacetamido-2,4,6-trideoxy-beta-L-altropyranose hydrolase
MKRSVLFGASGGRQAGLGHVRRCLSLAGALRERGVECSFVAHGDAGVAGWVGAAGFPATVVHSGLDLIGAVREAAAVRAASAIVIDSYEVPPAGLSTLLALSTAVVAIDDLADRALPVHLVVNGGVEASALNYRGLSDTQYLLGPAYALLRPEFADEPRRAIADRAQRALVTVGGSDALGLLAQLVCWTRETLADAEIHAIVSPLSDGQLLESAAGTGGGLVVHRDPEDVRGLMLSADLAVCAGGQTAYELAATGTPAIAIQVAANQAGNLRGLEAAGAALWVGRAGERHLGQRVRDALHALAGDAAARTRMSQAGRRLIDGRGVERVAQALLARSEGPAACSE